MDNKTISDRELDNLLVASRRQVPDDGFSPRVVRRLRRRTILSSLIPLFSGSIGALIVIAALPSGWIPSVLHRMTDPIFDASKTNSSELLIFLASYGIEPSLFWIFLVVPLFILPFALQHE